MENVSQNHRLWHPFWVNLWALGHLGLPWDLKGSLGTHFKLPFLRILSSNGSPIGDPKFTLGASRCQSELPMTSYGGDFVRTYFLYEIGHPKFTQKVFFLNGSAWLKHSKSCIELTFSWFSLDPGSSFVWDPFLDFLLTLFCTCFGSRCANEGVNKSPRWALRGGPFF